jgi:spore germination protein
MRAGEDTVVNVALTRRGVRAYRARDLHLTHRSRCTNTWRLLRHHFQRGRGMGRILLSENAARGGTLRRAIRPYGTRYLARRLGTIRASVGRWGGELEADYRRVRPWIAAGAIAALSGIWFELLRPRRGKAKVLLGDPAPAGPARARGPARERFPAEIEVNAYVMAGQAGAGGELLQAAGRLTWVSPFAYRAAADGELVAPADEPVLEEAAVAGAAGLMTVTNLSERDFDADAGSALLRDPGARERLLDAAMARIEERGYRGLNVDFERLPRADREPYNDFLRRAAERLHAQGLVLGTAVGPVRGDDDRGGEWGGAHDHEAHGRIADFVVLMAYQWVRATGPAGPGASIRDVSAAVRWTLRRVPPSKLMLGVPLYGLDWTLRDGGGVAGPPRGVSLPGARELAERHGADAGYDESVESPYFRYTDGDGADHLVWFEDDRSLRAKLDLVRAFGLRGVSLWRLPSRCPEVWTAIDELFAVRPAPAGDDLLLAPA